MKNVTSDKRNLWMFPLGTVGRDMIYNLFTNFIFTYILFTRHLTAAQLGAVTAIMVGARVFDALNDPVMGNIIERMTILENGTTLTLDTMRRCNLRLPAEDPAEAQTGLSPSLRIQDAEHTAILAALKKCCGNKAAAARMLGISYSTLWRKLKQNPADAAE